MDEFTTIPVVVIENVLTYTADQGKRHGFSVLAFGVLLTIKAAILVFAVYKMNKCKFRAYYNGQADKARGEQSGVEMP